MVLASAISATRPGWRNWQTQRTQNPPRATSWGFDPPSRHQQNKELKLKMASRNRRGQNRLVAVLMAVVAIVLQREKQSHKGRNLAERIGLFTSTHKEDQPCGDWFVTGGIRLPFLPTRWSVTHTPNPSNSRRVRAAVYSSRIAAAGFRRIARCAGR